MTPATRVTNLARLALALGRVDRITQHPDGYPESDTDHTVMLALVAAELAPERLDRGLVLAYATVHDLVEAYAGDTPTLVALDDAGRAAKDAREAAALDQIRTDLGADSWVVRTIEAFEAQADAEARWVKHMDKAVPKLTHVLNGGRSVREQGVTLEGVRRRVAGQLEHAERTSPDLPEAVALGWELMERVEAAWEDERDEAPATCRHEGCAQPPSHGPDGEQVVCWGHAGDWSEVPRG